MRAAEPVMTCHQLTLTDAAPADAQMTGLTGVSDITNQSSMTHDRCSLVPPYNARRTEEQGNPPEPSSGHPDLPLMPTDRYITDRAQLGRCRHCQQPIIRADLGAQIHISVDPHRLTPLAELEHKLAGLRTYELLPDEPTGLGAPILRTRLLSEIRWRPGRGLPAHQCGTRRPLDPDIRARLAPTRRVDDQADEPLDQEAPF